MTAPETAPAPAHRSRTAAGFASLAFGLLASVPLGLFLGAEVGLADARTVADNLAWGAAVVTLGAIAIYGGVPAALIAVVVGVIALVRNTRVGKGCGLAGLLLGGVTIVWVAIAVVPNLGGAGFA
ncbi:MAG: hypothetical protein R2717_02460 [Schumannella sp.]